MIFDKKSEYALGIVLALFGLLLAFGPETINLVKTSATTLFGLVVLGIGLWLLLKNA
ncbi:MAG: hypothetical protein J4445_01015 [DPANN group archaeon]|nr:hypothetical protein [DPANN group archaeon]